MAFRYCRLQIAIPRGFQRLSDKNPGGEPCGLLPGFLVLQCVTYMRRSGLRLVPG